MEHLAAKYRPPQTPKREEAQTTEPAKKVGSPKASPVASHQRRSVSQVL